MNEVAAAAVEVFCNPEWSLKKNVSCLICRKKKKKKKEKENPSTDRIIQ